MIPALHRLPMAAGQKAFLFNQALTSCRATPSIQHPVWASANERQYRNRPTRDIGKWRNLIKKEVVPKKKKDRLQMKPIVAETKTAYGTLNVKVSGYDMTLVEHYSQYIHNLCNRLSIKVSESYALPTKSTEVLVMQEQSTKMFSDAVLKTHERVVQLRTLDSALCPVFMDVILKNQPEGIELSVQKHSEADFQARFKGRPELEGLLAQIGPTPIYH